MDFRQLQYLTVVAEHRNENIHFALESSCEMLYDTENVRTS